MENINNTCFDRNITIKEKIEEINNEIKETEEKYNSAGIVGKMSYALHINGLRKRLSILNREVETASLG